MLSAVAGCGGGGAGGGGPAPTTTGGSGSSTAPRSQAPAPLPALKGPALDAQSLGYVGRANSVCAADLVGIPQSLKAPYTAASVAQYAAATAPSVRRTVLALARLHPPRRLALAAKGMVRAYGKLLPLYASVAAQAGSANAPGAAARNAQLISARQGTATALAQAARLASCQLPTG